MQVTNPSADRGGRGQCLLPSRVEVETLDARIVLKNSKPTVRSTDGPVRKWLLAIRQHLLVATFRTGTEELVSASFKVLAIETQALASIDEAERGADVLQNTNRLTAKNRNPVHVKAITRVLDQGFNPEIDVAAIRRKRDVPIFIRSLLQDGVLAIRRNMVDP